MNKKHSPKQDEKKKRIKNELKGIALGAATLFIFLSLVSHSPRDPSFTHYSASPTGIKNIFGTFGSHVADLLLLLLGYAAYLVPLFLLLLSLNFFLDKKSPHGKSFILGSLGMLLSFPLILNIVSSQISIEAKNAGGLLGVFLMNTCSPFLNKGGTLFVAITVFLLATVAAVNFSLVVFTTGFFRMVMRFFYYLRRKIELLQREAKNIRQMKKTTEPVIEVQTPPSDTRAYKKHSSQERFDFYYMDGSYNLPHLDLLDNSPKRDSNIKKDLLIANSKILEAKLADFDVEAKVNEVRPGPVVTTYEVEPAAGVKITKITSLNNDLALALRAKSIRIAPIAGKGTLGIEIPNITRDAVCLKSLLESEIFRNSSSKLSIALGENVVGMPVITHLEKMPHLLIAGTTGSGKSVALNAMICSVLFKAAPDEVKFLLIDPKRIELSPYDGIPHLLHPVVFDPKEAALALRWAVEEMERRYVLIGDAGARNVEGYNRTRTKISSNAEQSANIAEGGSTVREKLPYIVVVIDELADLMMVAQRNVETSLARLAQKARAAGIHLILATQRPSVDVITGIIKANFSTRISFHVSTKVDSRTVLDQQGAEDLLGAGDMLFMHSGSPELMRIHGAFVSEKEIERIVEYIKKQRSPIYNTEIISDNKSDESDSTAGASDEYYQEAVNIALKRGEISISFLQRQLNIGYNRAAKMVERMEAEGLVGPADGSKMRKVNKH